MIIIRRSKSESLNTVKTIPVAGRKRENLSRVVDVSQLSNRKRKVAVYSIRRL